MSSAQTAAFTSVVALLAILSDAALGHALAWENDPYWTYWITKTFLIATVFGLGTAWLGVGVGRGAVITAVHTVVLTVYYWSLSPIGLPGHPEWLDLEHTWLTGVPIHFGVIYLGYLAALWIWRRRPSAAVGVRPEANDRALKSPRLATETLAVAVVVVILAGVLEALALGEFQGVTWYVVRLLIVVPMLLIWQTIAGRDVPAAIGGAALITAALVTYSHFLGPVGLPDLPMRIFESSAPGATVHWLGYRQAALVAMPITFAAVLVGLLVLSRANLRQWRPMRSSVAALLAGTVIAIATGAIVAPDVGPDAAHAEIAASGPATAEVGSWFAGRQDPVEGELHLTAVNRNPRVTPLPPHDTVDLQASVRHPDGSTYTVRATQPMVDDPAGRYTTWWGVGLDVWHHGRTGIGTPQVPAVHAPVAIFAMGDVTRDGTPVAAGVPIHVMAMQDGKIELDVGDPQGPSLPGLPDGHLRVTWPQATVTTASAHTQQYLFGLVVLALLLLLTAAGLRQQQRT